MSITKIMFIVSCLSMAHQRCDMSKCMYPYMVERKLYFNQGDRLVPVPCGKCPSCLKRRVAGWSLRLEKEQLRWPKTMFLTLTYDTDHVPISPNSFMTLDSKHVTLFLKRIRKRGGSLRYYYCGEYGTHGKRPHYHMILFCTEQMTQSIVIREWIYGGVYFGKVEPASIKYTVQYYDKGDWRPAHGRDDRVKEFSRMSNGLGNNMMTGPMVRHMLDDPSRAYIYNSDGHKVAIPRYYKKRLYDQHVSDSVVSAHPSLLIHRDEMLDAREHHNQVISDIMLSLPVEEDSAEKNADRMAAIINYRNSKRKTRK